MEHHRKPRFEMEGGVSDAYLEPVHYGRNRCLWLKFRHHCNENDYPYGIGTMSVVARRKNQKASDASGMPALIARALTTNTFVLKDEPKVGRTGRPSAITQAIVLKLEVAFAFDSTVEEACLYAGISRNTFYEFTKKHPDFQDRIAALRNAPILMARMCVLRAAEHDANLALKYLERKRPEEFSLRAHVHVTNETSDRHSIDPATAALIRKAMGNFERKVMKDMKEKKSVPSPVFQNQPVLATI